MASIDESYTTPRGTIHLQSQTAKELTLTALGYPQDSAVEILQNPLVLKSGSQ
jgi:hypothetical protein